MRWRQLPSITRVLCRVPSFRLRVRAPLGAPTAGRDLHPHPGSCTSAGDNSCGYSFLRALAPGVHSGDRSTSLPPLALSPRF